MTYIYMRRVLLLVTACTLATGVFAQEEQGSDVAVNQYGAKVESFNVRAQTQNNILVFENKKRNYKIWFDNRVQMDGATYFNLKNGMVDDKGKSVMPGGVTLRRVRAAVKAQISDDWYGELDVDLANGVFELKDALLEYSGLKDFTFTAGNFKEDFSMEETTTSRYLTFMERPMVISAFAPSRHLGFSAQWMKYRWLRVSGGISWQAVDNANTSYNVQEFNKAGRAIGANYTGKIVFMPSFKDGGLHFGYNASLRSAHKTDDNVDGAEALGRGYEGDYFSTRNATSISRYKFINAEYYGVKHDFLQGFEVAGYYKGLKAAGEIITNTSVMDPNYVGATANMKAKHFWGYYAYASYLLFGGRQQYNARESEFTQPVRGRKWGDVEISARFDYINMNSEDIFGGSGQNITLGATFHVNNNVKLMVNYQISKDDKYANNKGKAIIGDDINGTPTSNPKLAASNFGARFNTLQMRCEIDF